MKKIILIALTIALKITVAQELVNKDYDFRVKQATQLIAKKWVGYDYDTITHRYSLIQVRPKQKEITIDYTDQDSESFKIKEKESTYPNNRMFWCKYDGAWYKFTFVRLDNQMVHLNIESVEKNLSISFLLKEN